MEKPTILVWYRNDLRVTDNPALYSACQSAERLNAHLLPIFIFDAVTPGVHRIGGASRWWLYESLMGLDQSLRRRGSRLMLRQGPADEVLQDIIARYGVTEIHWNRRYEPWATAADADLKAALKDQGVVVSSHQASLLVEPWSLKTKTGGPYRVYTPFSKACFARIASDGIGDVSPAPTTLPPVPSGFASDRLDEWELQPTAPNWASEFPEHWRPGERGAVERLSRFVDETVTAYGDERNRPDIAGTSGLSPHLRWGEISPRRIWQAMEMAVAASGAAGLPKGPETFLKEILWREFAYSLLFHFPHLPETPLDGKFSAMPWRRHYGDVLTAWQRGETGYPLVDAGMRQLRRTGWMHNRVRMVAASFLIKHLMVPWQEGQAWFWDTLVDADLASNSASWQWVAGCGADAAPYFRIFNPTGQAEKFDPDGDYIRRWVPELARLPKAVIHKPWEATPMDLKAAGVSLGGNYPRPIVDHPTARGQALAAYDVVKAARVG